MSSAATWTSTWNPRGLLSTDTLSIGGKSFRLKYAYDGSGHLSSLTYPSGRVVNYAPDGLGRPTRAGNYAFGARYAPNGHLSALTYANGVSARWLFNLRQLLWRTVTVRRRHVFGGRRLW